MSARRMKPTRKHRPAIVPGILGTVYGINDDGEARYFDYDREGAEAFAGVTSERDPRYAKVTADRRASFVRRGATEANPRVGTGCIWIMPAEKL
jgi:hypothetical protein